MQVLFFKRVIPVLFIMFSCLSISIGIAMASDEQQFTRAPLVSVRMLSSEGGMIKDVTPPVPYVTATVAIKSLDETVCVDMFRLISVQEATLFDFTDKGMDMSKEYRSSLVGFTSKGIDEVSGKFKMKENGCFEIPAGEEGVFEFSAQLQFSKSGTYEGFIGGIPYRSLKTGEEFTTYPGRGDENAFNKLKVTCSKKSGCSLKIKEKKAEKPPSIKLTAKPRNIEDGESTRISWDAKKAKKCYILDEIVDIKSSIIFGPDFYGYSSGRFSIECVGNGGSTKKSVQVMKERKVKELEQVSASLKTTVPPKLFSASKNKISVAQGQSDVELSKIKILPQKEDTYINAVYVDVTPVKKNSKDKPWDSLRNLTLWIDESNFMSVDLGLEDNWVLSKNTKGEKVYTIKIYDGNYKIQAKKGNVIIAKISSDEDAKVGSMWKVSVPVRGIETWTQTYKGRKYSGINDLSVITITKKFDEFQWMYEQSVGVFVSKIEGKYSRATESVARVKDTPVFSEFTELLQLARNKLDLAQDAIKAGKYKKASQYADEAQEPLLLIINTGI